MTPFAIVVCASLLIIVGITIGRLMAMPEQLRLSNENAQLHMRLEASNPIHNMTRVVREPQFLVVTTKQHNELVKNKVATQLLAPLVAKTDQ